MINEDIKNLMQGISFLSQMTQKLGDRAMQGDNPNNIMREGSDIRNMIKGMDFEVTKLEGRSKKDNPSVYDVEVDQYTTDETGKVKSRINELMEATADFDNAMGMQMGGLSNQMVGDPRISIPDDPTARQQESELIRAMNDPMLRLIQRQRAGFFPQLGFGADPYAIDIARGLGQKIETFPEGTSSTTSTRIESDNIQGDGVMGGDPTGSMRGGMGGIGGLGGQTYDSVMSDLGGITGQLPGTQISDYLPRNVTTYGTGDSEGEGIFSGVGNIFNRIGDIGGDFIEDLIDILNPLPDEEGPEDPGDQSI